MQMQKKIIALAIASAMTVPALAYAEATVYGQVNLSIDVVSDGMATSTTANQLNSNTSRLGLKGSEDLGSGMSVVWQVEGTLAPDTGATDTSLFNRNNFLGLKSNDLGTALLGKIDSPYKTSTRRLDLFGDGIADNRGSQVAGSTAGDPFKTTMMGGGHDARLDNAIAYMSPSMGGMSVALATVFGAETSPQPAAPNDKKGSAYSLAGMYDQGPIYATLAYQTMKEGSPGTGDLAGTADDESTAMKLGGSFTTDMFMVGLVWEDLSSKVAIGGAETTSNNIYVSGKFNLGSADAIKLAYTDRGDTSAAGDDSASQVTLGYDHSMSKATTVYALYSKETQNATGAADPSVVSFGMKHSF